MKSLQALHDRLVCDYFSDPMRRVRVPKGTILLEPKRLNDKLYFVNSGVFAGSIPGEDEVGDELWLELFRSGPGSFIGVSSFFSDHKTTFMRVYAVTEAEVTWIDANMAPVNAEEYGGIREQFMPVIMEELIHRQLTLHTTARERESALRRLHLSENLSTLGRLSAGIAHELNNAIGVLGRTTDHLRHVLEMLLHTNHPDQAEWFDRGVQSGQEFSSEVVRRRGKELAARFGISYEQGKGLARVFGEAPVDALPDNFEHVLSLWETGRACHDMELAARHAGSIVKSVRDLGGATQQRADGVDVNTTVLEAVSLLQSALRKVTVSYALAENLPTIWGNATELVQIWINIMRNACDALRDAGTPDPRINIETSAHRRGVEVILSNNGPPIPEGILRRLFLPHITTKKGENGGSMGMGLGLYIIKRLVDSYCGDLHVESGPDMTIFSVRLPLRHEELDIDS